MALYVYRAKWNDGTATQIFADTLMQASGMAYNARLSEPLSIEFSRAAVRKYVATFDTGHVAYFDTLVAATSYRNRLRASMPTIGCKYSVEDV